MISRSSFKKAIEYIKYRDEVDFEIRTVLQKLDNDNSLFTSTGYQDMLIKVLNESFKLKACDLTGTDIDYFIYELDYGKKWKKGTYIDNGKDVRLKTIDDLYDVIIKQYDKQKNKKG